MELYHYGVLGMKWGVHRRQKLIDSKRQVIKENIDSNNRSIKRLQNNMDDIKKNGSNSGYIKEKFNKTKELNPGRNLDAMIDLNQFTKTSYKELKDHRDWQIRRGKSYVNALTKLDNLDPATTTISEIRKSAKIY